MRDQRGSGRGMDACDSLKDDDEDGDNSARSLTAHSVDSSMRRWVCLDRHRASRRGARRGVDRGNPADNRRHSNRAMARRRDNCWKLTYDDDEDKDEDDDDEE